jgi:iron complex outermembrane receptor protein
MSAKFRGNTRSNGVAVGGNWLPFSPKYMLNGGTQYSFAVAKDVSAFVRGEVTAFGKFYYDDQNVRSQGTYALTNFRAGVRARGWRIEAWVRNAFDEDYVPMAIPFATAPSGFVGETGAPRTMGLSVGLRF